MQGRTTSSRERVWVWGDLGIGGALMAPRCSQNTQESGETPQLGEPSLRRPQEFGRRTPRVRAYPHTGQEDLGMLPDVRVLLGCQQVGDQDSASHHGEPPKTGSGQGALKCTGVCWGLLKAPWAILGPTEAIQGLTGDYWVLLLGVSLGLQGPYWDLVGATGSYWVSVGVYWGHNGSLGSSGICWVPTGVY